MDAVLLTCDGEAAFIDGGYRTNGVKCVKYMQKLGISKLRAYIGTHGHKNHIGGAGAVIHAMKPDRVYVNRMETKDAIIRHTQSGSEREAAKNAAFAVLRPGDINALGGARISCLGPLKIKDCASGAVAENHNSLILRVDYMGRSLLLTGDTSACILESIDAGDTGCI